MKKIYLFAALAAMLAACSENDLTKETAVQQNADEGAVQFSAYMNRGTTRAGAPGTLTTAGTGADFKKVSLQTEGFGVLSYYNDGEPYSENSKPDFMYNQKVTYVGSTWQYNPVKYWPNEFGSDAISEGTDRLTFFAYAPYVDVDLTTGLATGESTTGIIALTRNTTHGDPFVKYYADFNPEKRVDLCWGVAKSKFESSVTGSANKVEAGEPYIDVVKPKVDDKINFDFKHALAALNVTIDADINEAGHGINGYVDTYTKIWVRSITFEGFTDKGMLNLNGSAIGAYTPEWYDLSGNNKIGSGGKTTIHDGLRDGSEPLGEASNETPAALNPQIIQSYPYVNTTLEEAYNTGLTTTTALTGVPHAPAINLFNSTTPSEPIYVIPTNDDLKVTIVYDVETADKNLTNYLADGAVRGSCVENKITKEIKISNSSFKLKAGKLYTIALHLGMTSVKFEASVTEWGAANATDDTWLPVNAPSASVAVGNTKTLEISADKYEGSLQVTGLSGSTATVTVAGDHITSPTSGTSVSVDANGTANINFVVEPNNTIAERTGGTTSQIKVGTAILNITQAPHALALKAPEIAADGKITLTSGASGMLSTDWTGMAGTISVSKKDRNGTVTPFTGVKDADPTPGSTFKVESTTGTSATLTFAAADVADAGDVLTITVNPDAANKADEETVTLKVGGIAFVAPANEQTIEYGYVGFNPTPTFYGITSVTSYSDCVSSEIGTADVTSTTNPEIKVANMHHNNGDPTTITMKVNAHTPVAGYGYTNKSMTATYDLTVAKASGTISYSLDNTTASAVTGGTDILDVDDVQTAELKNSHGDLITKTINYALVSVDDVVGSTVFAMNAGKLVVGTADLVSKKVYKVQIKATVDDDSDVTFTTNNATATFYVTAP